ncbi:hypothetical protein IX307_000555 [Bacteroides pyogenes]|nr:hypothetical protein [Bacteroides pyogenes]MBR8724399.1 hypothetical protein [Bacteroides pyogenes]MBR8737752.1 hypothetical protein [Bacteroides pyogenes]MBR8753475.1 hypothetical protein [Bacteroides pyogenes]MBR8786252.1 hypothetical protein [Bacteroides pyogenes]
MELFLFIFLLWEGLFRGGFCAENHLRIQKKDHSSPMIYGQKHELHKKSSDELVSFENLFYFYIYISNKHA